MKTLLSFKTATLTLLVVAYSATSAFAQKPRGEKNKFLEGKKFDVQFYEMKAAGRGKAVKSLFLIKSGKIESDLTYEKMGLQPMAYRVTLDSTYTEDENEMHMVSIEAADSQDKSDFEWKITVINYDIEGTVTQSKGGVEKKKYEFAGAEKTKKK